MRVGSGRTWSLPDRPCSRVQAASSREEIRPDAATALAAYESPRYQEALAVLGDAADREIRVIEGV